LENQIVERASVLVFNLFASIARARKKLAVRRACVRACVRASALLNVSRTSERFCFFEFSRRQHKKSLQTLNMLKRPKKLLVSEKMLPVLKGKKERSSHSHRVRYSRKSSQIFLSRAHV
jgi:hypothetical protein